MQGRHRQRLTEVESAYEQLFCKAAIFLLPGMVCSSPISLAPRLSAHRTQSGPALLGSAQAHGGHIQVMG